MHLQRLTCLWPGLPKLWFAGDRVGLGIAIIFSLAGNALLLLSFQGSTTVHLGNSPWIGSWVGWGWVLFLATWIGCVAMQARQSQESISRDSSRDRQRAAEHAAMNVLFQDAQLAYLARNWVSSETLVRSLLHDVPSDVESRLLLVSILRQTERFAEAIVELKRIEETDGSSGWAHEVRRERQRIEEWQSASEEDTKDSDAQDDLRNDTSEEETSSGNVTVEPDVMEPNTGGQPDARIESSDPVSEQPKQSENVHSIHTRPIPSDSSNGGESHLSNQTSSNHTSSPHVEDEPPQKSTTDFQSRSSSKAA